MKTCVLFILLLLSHLVSACSTEPVFPDNLFPEVSIKTNMGEISVELDRRRAPLTVNAFLGYVKQKAYANSMIHRVVENYVTQGGAFTKNGSSISSCGTVVNESGNGLSNKTMTIAMARHNEPHSAETSFFFNLQDNQNLDPNSKSWGYTVFGYVTSGQDVLAKIGAVKTGYNDQLDAQNVPLEPILILSMEIK